MRSTRNSWKQAFSGTGLQYSSRGTGSRATGSVMGTTSAENSTTLTVLSALTAVLLLVGVLIGISKDVPRAVAGLMICVTVYIVVSLCGWGNNCNSRTLEALRWMRIAGLVFSVITALLLSRAWSAVPI